MISRHPLSDLGRLSFEWKLARETEKRLTSRRIKEWCSIMVHLGVCKRPDRGSTHHDFDEDVFVNDHLPSHRLVSKVAERVLDWPRRSEIVEGWEGADELEEGETKDTLLMLVCPVEPKRRAPVLDDEDDFPLRHDGVEEGGKVASMLYEIDIRSWACQRRPCRSSRERRSGNLRIGEG